MKFRIEVDCTPEEARQFCGLPDLRPLHAAVMAKVERQMLDAAEAVSPENTLKTWLSLMPQNATDFWKNLSSFFPAPPTGGGKPPP